LYIAIYQHFSENNQQIFKSANSIKMVKKWSLVANNMVYYGIFGDIFQL